MNKAFKIRANNSLLLIFLVLFTKVSAQTFSGVILDDISGKPINQVLIQLKLSNENKILAFGKTNEKGEYLLTLKDDLLLENAESLVLELRKIDYETYQHEFIYDANKSDYIQELYITTSKIALAPIVVKGKIRPLKEKKDTVTYNVEAYKDGSESVIEDVLKNMPGIEVSETSGMIKYKGTPIEKVLLEGDDLFDNNYTAGTRNISTDIVKSVEAIENWSENELLHGIEDTQKVALNLRLKKSVINYSGNANLGYGIKDKFNNGIHGIGVSHKYKNFTTLSQNNVGRNNAPYNYFYSFLSKDEKERLPFMAEKIIEEERFRGALAEKVNQNELWYGNFNQIINLNEKHNLRVNASYLQDKLKQNKAIYSSYKLKDETLNTSEVEDKLKKPKLIDLNFKWTWKKGDNSMLSLESKWFDEKIDSYKSLFVNTTDKVKTELNSRNYFLKNELVFTKRVNNQNAYQLSGIYSTNSSPQQLSILPGLDFLEDNFLEDIFNHQSVRTTKDRIHIEGNYLGKFKRGNKYQLNAYVDYNQQEMNSWLTQIDQCNDLDYNILDGNIDFSYNFLWKGFIIKPEMETHYYDLKWKDHLEQEEKKLSKIVFNPKLSIRKNLTSTSNLILASNFNSKAQDFSRLYNNFVMNTERVLINNQASLEFQESFYTTLNFKHTSFYNQFETEWRASYQQQSRVYFMDTSIKYNYKEVGFFQLPEKNKTLSLYGMIEKYIPFLTSTARLKGTYTRMNFKNKINSGELRDVLGQTIFAELFYKTAFDIPIILENTFRIRRFQSSSGELYSFKNTSITNKTRLMFVPNKKLYSSITLEYYQPKISGSNNIFFLDFDLNYRLNKPKMRFGIQARNLTANKVYESIFVNDFSRIRTTQNLYPRYVLLTMAFNF